MPTIAIDANGLQIDWTPNPGSDEAIADGCTCPIIDNAHGAGFPLRANGEPSIGFYMNADCPLHGRK
jgi:hypothetical protein